ncbi:MAG: hypothetical protein Q4G21_09560 [Dermabacter sp.]|nr:hypothetical protein [Dermabacter sp.]
MPNITTHYGITSPVPFVDVEVTADNRLYVDPHAIRLSRLPQPFADEALECIDSFAREVTACVVSSSSATRLRGESLLKRFAEPRETRLGMSVKGFHGHGGADIVGAEIWAELNSNAEALVRVGLLRQLEDLPMFVKGVDRDITSDITTRIIFEPLARFTEKMLDQYPQFTSAGHTVKTDTQQVWSSTACEWADAPVTLPVIDGEPLLLVPQQWARPALLMSARRFHDTSALSFAQLKQAVRTLDGMLIKTPKARLKHQPGFGPGRLTNIRITLEAYDDGENLVDTFKSFVADRYDDDTDGQVAA